MADVSVGVHELVARLVGLERQREVVREAGHVDEGGADLRGMRAIVIRKWEMI